MAVLPLRLQIIYQYLLSYMIQILVLFLMLLNLVRDFCHFDCEKFKTGLKKENWGFCIDMLQSQWKSS